MVRDRILLLMDLLLGAAYADDEFTEGELRAVRTIVAGLLDVDADELPEELEARLRTFDPVAFDLGTTAAAFQQDPPSAKQRLLEVVGTMVSAGGGMAAVEGEYLRDLSQHLGLNVGNVQNAYLEYEVDELREAFAQLRAAPPPMVNADGVASRPPPPPLVVEPPEE